MFRNLSRFLTFVSVAAAAGCGGTPEVVRVCPEFPGRVVDRAPFTFVLTEPVVPGHAPVPTNDSEAILFTLAYDTLIEASCEGELEGRLAQSWRRADSVWTLRVDGDATLSTGKRLRADDIIEAWRERRSRLEPTFAGWAWSGLPADAIGATEDGEVVVAVPGADLPSLLTDPAFAIGLDDAPPWPLGTSGRLLDPDEAGVANAAWVWERDDAAAPGASRVLFRQRTGADPRDLASTDADAFFVRDRRVLGYLQQLEGFTVTPCPWSRLYVLLTTQADLARRVRDDDLEDLAQRVAIGDARPVGRRDRLDFGDHDDDTSGAQAPLERIVFPDWDADALAIAERLSFLLSRGRGTAPPAIVPKRSGEFLTSLAAGRDLLYVVPIWPRLANDTWPRERLLRSAPWLAHRGAAVPLIETRGHLVAREGLGGFAVGADGLPRLRRAGWTSRRGTP